MPPPDPGGVIDHAIEQAAGGEIVYLTRAGEPVVAIVPVGLARAMETSLRARELVVASREHADPDAALAAMLRRAQPSDSDYARALRALGVSATDEDAARESEEYVARAEELLDRYPEQAGT